MIAVVVPAPTRFHYLHHLEREEVMSKKKINELNIQVLSTTPDMGFDKTTELVLLSTGVVKIRCIEIRCSNCGVNQKSQDYITESRHAPDCESAFGSNPYIEESY